MSLINCENNLFLTWSATFAITDENLYFSTVTLLFRINQRQCKTVHQLKSGFKRTTNRDKYQSKAHNQYLDYVADPGF